MKKSIIQKVLSMILAVLLMFSIIPMSGLAQSSVAFRYGDVTGDGEVDAKDALEVLKAAVNKITLNEQQTKDNLLIFICPCSNISHYIIPPLHNKFSCFPLIQKLNFPIYAIQYQLNIASCRCEPLYLIRISAQNFL